MRVIGSDTTSIVGPVVALATALSLAAVLFKDGGFFPPVWGWTALAMLWATAVGVALGAVKPSTPALAMLAAFAALAGWTALSAAWSSSLPQSLLEGQRLLVYPSLLAALFVLGRGRQRAILVGVFGALLIVCIYALATRLLPERLGAFDPIATYRLSEPVGYWNALGLVAVLGIVLALGFAGRGESDAYRIAGAASVPILASVAYFTYSRGAWAALAGGLLVVFALDRSRVHLSVVALALLPWSAAAVVLASRSEALTTQGARLADASQEGHRFAGILAGLVALSAVTAWALSRLGRRVDPAPRLRALYVTSLAMAGLVSAAAGLALAGGPHRVVEEAYDRFTAPPPAAQPNLNRRLFSISSGYRNLHWRVAWQQYTDHPLLGSGAGTYEQFWLRERPIYKNVRDAHSLYLETLAELGPMGLALLLTGLALPLSAAKRLRRSRPLVPAVLGAYVAYLLHAGIDWDWELTGVSMAALALGAVPLLEDDRDAKPLGSALRVTLSVTALGIGTVALATALGQTSLAQARAANENSQYGLAAARAREAHRWAPWSSEPWEVLGEAQERAGLRDAARRSYRHAVALDPNDWELWADLARLSEAEARREAIARARALNPRSLLLDELVAGRER